MVRAGSATPAMETELAASANFGITNATAVTSGLSEVWQHDIVQFITSPVPASCPQSTASEDACFFW
jgi:hypothetical protein